MSKQLSPLDFSVEIQPSALAVLAMNAALLGAAEARNRQLAGLRPQQKSADRNDLVTEGDEAAQHVIVQALPRSMEGNTIDVLAEEKISMLQVSADARWRWVIDPIDGTLPYSKGEHYWCVSVALQEKNREWESRLGVIYQASAHDRLDKLHGRLFFAEQGKGTFLHMPSTGVTRQLVKPHITAPSAELSAQGAFGAWATQEFAARGIATGFRRSICHAACEMFIGEKCALVQDAGPLEWDVAAMALIAKEAGAHIHLARTDRLATCDRYEVVMTWDIKLFGALMQPITA